MPPELKDDFEIFYHSAPLPRALVVVRHGLPPLLEEQIKQAQRKHRDLAARGYR